MPFLRDTILSVMPASWRESAIADSKTWIADCTRCDNRSNVWDLGGMRWKAYGQPLTLFPCPVCRRPTMHKLHKG